MFPNLSFFTCCCAWNRTDCTKYSDTLVSRELVVYTAGRRPRDTKSQGLLVRWATHASDGLWSIDAGSLQRILLQWMTMTHTPQHMWLAWDEIHARAQKLLSPSWEENIMDSRAHRFGSRDSAVPSPVHKPYIRSLLSILIVTTSYVQMNRSHCMCHTYTIYIHTYSDQTRLKLIQSKPNATQLSLVLPI